MWFTAPEKTRNPNANIIITIAERFDVVLKKSYEMFLEFSGNDVLIQFLHEYIIFFLVNFDDAVNFTVNIVFKHWLDFHGAAPCSDYTKCPIIRIRRQFIEKFDIASIKWTGIHNQYRDIRKIWLHGVQQSVNSDKRERLANAGY